MDDPSGKSRGRKGRQKQLVIGLNTFIKGVPLIVKDPELIKNQVIEVLKTKDPRYHCIITVDTDFISY